MKKNKLKCQKGGSVSSTGYLPDSPDRFNPYNVIPSDLITMSSVPHDILAIPDKGQPKLMKKNSGLHKFIGANQVTEIPMFQDGGLQFYPGGLQSTPTGQSNAFVNNSYGLTPEIINQIAQRHKFRTDNNVNFQTDLENYINTNNPEIMGDVLGKYGKNKKNKFADGMIGARTMYALSQLNKVPSPVAPQQPASTPVVDPMAGFRGEPLYDANNHLIALSEYNGGDAQKANARMVFVDKMGKPDMTRGMFSIPGTEWSNKYTKGVKRLYTEEGLDQYRVPGVTASKKDGGLIAQMGTEIFGQSPNPFLWNTESQIPPMKVPFQSGIKVDQTPGTPAGPYQGMAIEQGKNPGEWVGKRKATYESNPMAAAMVTGAMSMFADELERVPDHQVYAQQIQRATSDSQFATKNPTLKRGFIDQNSGRSAPNLQTYTQYANQLAPNYYGQGEFIPFAQDGMSMGPGMLPDMIAPPEMMPFMVDTSTPLTTPSVTTSNTPSLTPSNNEVVSEDGYEQIKSFIKKQEGFAKKAKWDYKQFTNGYGTKAKFAGEELTRKEAEQRLDEYLAPTIEKIKSKIQVPISNSQLAAVTSIAYNGGMGVVRKIINQINKGADVNTVAGLIKKTATTVNNGATVLDALVARRKREAGLFLQQYKEGGEYDLSPEQVKYLQDAGYELEFS